MQQEMQSKNKELAQRFNQLEDRLILISLPALIGVLVLWAVLSAYPVLSTIGYLIITIAVLLIYCVVLIRITQVIRDWVMRDSPGLDNALLIPGSVLLCFLIAISLFVLVDMIFHAGEFSGSRTFLIIGLFATLIIQYRAIILRYLRKPEPH